MLRRIFLVFLIIPLCASAGVVSGADQDLASGFRNPPDSAKPHTWWHWCNDNISKEGITADLEAMKRVGVGGAQIFNVDVGVPSGGVKFMTDEWREMIKHAVKEADRLGIELCIHNCAGWSSSGGPWVKPEHAMQIVVTSEQRVKGPTRFDGTLKTPQTRHGYYRDIAVLAFPTPALDARIDNIRAKAAYDRVDNILPPISSVTQFESIIRPEKIVDITRAMSGEGRLTWNVPEGDWTIMRIGHTPMGKDNHPATNEGRGLECDKMSREALDAHWGGMMKTVIDEIGPLTGKTLNNSLVDSYEVGSQNWTPGFLEEFKKRRGYDLLPFLPVYTGRIVRDREVSERFLWDLRRTISDMFDENYFTYFGELCHKHGMQFSTEPYGNGAFEDLACGGRADIPMGEFWVGGAARGTCKLAASVSHTYGRKFVGAESFTADPDRGRWQNDPFAMKALGDQIYCDGVNRFIFHRYAHQPWMNVLPGMTMGQWGFHFERTNTWFEQGKAWLSYITRCQYLLQQGRFVADVCYFTGDSAPNTVADHLALKTLGYDYDSCNSEILMLMSVRDRRIVLPSGMEYHVLVLPESEFMTPQTLEKVRDLVRAGATVIGPRPKKSPSLVNYPACDAEVERLAQEVWGDCDGKTVTEHVLGKGKMIWGKKVEDVLESSSVHPDFSFPRGSGRLEFIHRMSGYNDVYFVSNQRYAYQEVPCTFRISDKIPELWHPDTGTIEKAPVYTMEKDGRITVTLKFDPAGSVFVIFRQKAGSDNHLVSVSRVGGKEVPKPSMPNLEIKRAIYEAVDGAGAADVTRRVAELAGEGTLSFTANNDSLGGDPTPNHYKRLRIEYLLDGQPKTIVVSENDNVELPAMLGSGEPPGYEVMLTKNGAELLVWQPGTFEAKNSSGKVFRLNTPSALKPIELNTGWTVSFPTGWAAPHSVKFAKLISWTQHDDMGVRYFSGTATYVREFQVPDSMFKSRRVIYIDLGHVKNIAELHINGKNLGILWKPPFRVDITRVAKPGKNRIEAHITNMWVNRLIGDEQQPEDVQWNGKALAGWPQWFVEGKPRPSSGRLTFTTWKHFDKNSSLVESGLMGPVVIQAVERARVMP